MKNSKYILFLILCFFSTTSFLSASSKNNWYDKSRYGLFVHYVPGLTVYPKGGTTSDINVVANNFDAKQLATDAQAFGVEYVVFTVMHYRMRPLYPSAVTEKWRPGNSSARDCISDLINELKPKGIKLMLYVHTTDGYDFTAADQVATGFNVDSIHHYPIWNNYVNELMTEIGARYGTDIDGLWQDMCMSKEYKNMIDKPRLRASMLIGDPNRILVGNGSTLSDGMDYTSKEYYPSGAMTTWRTFAYQIATVVGGGWWAAAAQGQKAARLTPQQMYRFTVLQSAVTNDGGMAWDAGTYIGGGWEDGVKNMFSGCGNYINQVEPAIKGTLPSTSYITAVGKTLATINNGIVATKSPDDQYEYIHVLYPPVGNTLTLPAPADGKKFGEAIYMNADIAVTISQTASNVILTLPSTEKFDTVNSVIRLQVIDYPVTNTNYYNVNNTDTIIKYIGTKWVTSSTRAAGDYKDDVAATTLNGDYFQFAFSGDGIDFIAPKGPSYGQVEIFLDGVSKGIFSQYASSYLPQQVIYSNKAMTYGQHTIKGVKTGSTFMQLDAMRVYQNSVQAIPSIVANQANLRIYPTLANKEINIECQNRFDIQEFGLFSIEGKKIKSFTNLTNKISVNDLAKGTYILNFRFKDQSVASRMFLKN